MTSIYRILLIFMITPFTTRGVAMEDYKGKRVLYIDSYHEGYAWSDGITEGVVDVLKKAKITYKIYRMNTKINTQEEFKKKTALEAKKIIEEFNPDVVIASDDNASKYLIKPYFKGSKLPFVFCGINWDASIYGYPYKNTTGMIEVSLLPQLISRLTWYSKGDRVAYLASDNLTARKEANYYKKIFNIETHQVYVDDFKSWKKEFVDIQKKTDILIVGNNAGIKAWNKEEANAHVLKHTNIPTGTFYDFLTSYALIGLVKVAQEQGRWAAKSALKILSGVTPSSIPVAENQEGVIYLNRKIEKKLKIKFQKSLLKKAKILN